MNEQLLKLNTTTEDTLVMIREFKAPQELVFDVLSQSEHIASWQIPPNMELVNVETDLKVGGKYRIAMKSPDKGFEFELFGEYRTINRPDKLVFTQNVPSMTEMSEITIELSKDGENTQMVFIQRGLTRKMRDNGLRGWVKPFENLSEYIEKIQG